MDSTKTISLSQAFAHCASTASYWWSIGIVLAICVAGWIVIQFILAKKEDVSSIQKVWAIICLFAIAFAVFAAPEDVAANTSIQMAAHNQWLGY